MDNDNDTETWKEKRALELGFIPQQEIKYNFYLPYASTLDEESTELFDKIKQNLGVSIALRELNSATCVYVTKLMKYV
jgi:hypothetical protein